MTKPTVLIRIQPGGSVDYLANGDVRVVVVDENAPHDRVYDYQTRVDIEAIEAVIGESPVGSPDDNRHAAIKNRVVAELAGQRRLKVVEP